MIKIGGFGHIVDYSRISEAGYDFAELDIPEIASLSSSELKTLQQKIKNGIPVPIASRLLPVTEPLFFRIGFEPESLRSYLEEACQKTAELGVQAVILGNGKARSMLSKTDCQREDIFLETLKLIAEVVAQNRQELILEPLGPRYSNYINTVEQAVEIANQTSYGLASGVITQDINTAMKFCERHGLAKISCAGLGMKGTPGVMAAIARVLWNSGVKIYRSVDSFINISCLIDEKDLSSAISSLHSLMPDLKRD